LAASLILLPQKSTNSTATVALNAPIGARNISFSQPDSLYASSWPNGLGNFKSISSFLPSVFTKAGQNGGMNTTAPVRVCWFKRLGWIYRPVHPFGWITLLAALAFLAQVFLALDRRTHSVSDLCYNFYPYAASTFLGLTWIAARTSGENGGRT
jgi:hypothetical protein